MLFCTDLAQFSNSHANSVLSWRLRLMPGKTEIDSRVILWTIVSQLSPYLCFSLPLCVFLSTCQPHNTSSRKCDRGAIDMHQSSVVSALIKNTCFLEHLHQTTPFLLWTPEKITIKKQLLWAFSILSFFLILSPPLTALLIFSHILQILPLAFFHAVVKLFLKWYGVKGQLKHHTSLHFHKYSSAAGEEASITTAIETPLKTCLFCFFNQKYGIT